jgi:hypothetical protein
MTTLHDNLFSSALRNSPRRKRNQKRKKLVRRGNRKLVVRQGEKNNKASPGRPKGEREKEETHTFMYIRAERISIPDE